MNQPEYYTTNSYYYYNQQKRLSFLEKIKGNKPLVHLSLLLLTVLTTYMVNGLMYSLSIVSILLAHEMGHYLMCRRYRISATLPYFIPVPLVPFGTMGAFIKIKERIPNKRALFDVAVAGPLAGLALTIPILIIGLKYSYFVPLSEISGDATLSLGESFLFSQLAKIVIGPVPEGYDTILHPMAFAGWAGLFVTALNLLPIGQLDGGHVIYAIFGHRSRLINKVAMISFIVISAIWYPGWLLLIILLLWIGIYHPPSDNDYIPLDSKRVLIGYATIFIFLISFIPVPFRI